MPKPSDGKTRRTIKRTIKSAKNKKSNLVTKDKRKTSSSINIYSKLVGRGSQKTMRKTKQCKGSQNTI